MCRHEVVYYGCGHQKDLGFFCDNAQFYGPLFIKAGCPNYTYGESKNEPHQQCGEQGHFYCAQKQDGVVIDKAREALDVAEFHFKETKSKFEDIALKHASYVSQAELKGVSSEDLPKLAAYRELHQQHRYLGWQYGVAHNRVFYLNTIINHAWNSRERLELGAGYQPIWDGIKFDFLNSIFPPDILNPIKNQLPGFASKVPTSAAGIPLVRGSYQRHDLTPATITHTNASTIQQSQSPLQARSSQRAKTAQLVGPTNPTSTTTQHSSPMDPAVFRGNSPEGEDKMAKAVRIRDELAARRSKMVSDAMTDIGYDVKNNGLRPIPKVGHVRSAQATPTSTPSRKTARKPSKVEEADATPSKSRPSRRTRNSKPKYVESPNSSEKTLSIKEPSLDEKDAAWTASPTKSDAAFTDSPALSQESISPVRPARNSRARSKRNVQALTGSPNSSPMRGQVSLGEKILEYHKSFGSSTSDRPPRMQPYSAAPNDFHPIKNATIAQANLGMGTMAPPAPPTNAPFGSIQQLSNGQMPPNAVSQHKHKEACMQRGAQLVQTLGRDLYQQQLALGVVAPSTTGPAQSLPIQQQQQGAISNTEHVSQVMPGQQSARSSHTMSPESLGQYQQPAAANLFHQNYLQSMAANCTQPYSGFPRRSFSAGPTPVSPSLDQSSSGTLVAGSGPAPSQLAQPRADYESMRRSFSATANLTPQSSFDIQQNLAYTEPLKRNEVPTSSEPTSRKRIRLSLPGEGDVPQLAPTPPNFEPYMPADVAVDGMTHLGSYDAASAPVEEQYNGFTALDSTSLGDQPHGDALNCSGIQSSHDVMAASGDALAIDPQLYGTVHNAIDAKPVNNADLRRDSAGGEPHAAVPQFDQQIYDVHDAQVDEAGAFDTGSHLAGHANMSLPQDGMYAGGLDAFDLSSEPDWSLIQDDAY